jgi:hypothetical protein
MKYIANIVTKNKIQISEFYNVVDDINLIDNSLPTLIIGWATVKDIFPNQNILFKNITDNIEWTFSKREKRYQYEKDINMFIKKTICFLENNVNYHFFNFILSSEIKRNNFIKYVQKGNCSIYYNSKFLYIYNCIDKITIGISLRDLFYIGINIKNFIIDLNKNNNIIINNIDFIDNNALFLIKDNTKSIAYLNYLKNSDIYKKNGDD